MAKSQVNSVTHSCDPTAIGSTFVQKLKGEDLLLGATASEYLRPSLVKLYKYSGYDFIYIENEHTMFNGQEVTAFIQSARDNGLPVIAKTGQLERAEVARLLDAGVVGVQLPRTESRKDLMTLIDYMKFPPRGTRAGAPCFGNVDYLSPQDHPQWLQRADASTVVVAHIETVKGYKNAEQIVSTPHLDMVYVGPYDLSISFGHAGNYDHDAVRKPMLEILQLCRQYNVPFGTTASGPEAAGVLVALGCRFFEMADEMTLILKAATEQVAEYRELHSEMALSHDGSRK